MEKKIAPGWCFCRVWY